MIKNIQKDLRTYRKDTFITSFFATITILLIVLIICSVPAHAQEITGNDYSYDDSDMNNIREYYNFDFNATNPTGLLCYDLNSNFHKINGNIYNSSGYMFYNKNDASYNQYLQFLSDTNQTMMPSKFKYQGTTYNLSDYPYFVIISSYNNCNRVVVSKDSQFYCNNNTNEICQFYNDHPDTFVFEWAVGDTQGNPSIYRVTSKSNITINGVTREYLTYSNGYNFYLIYTNTSVKANEYSYSNNTYNYLNQDMELNYLLGQSGNGGSDGSSDESEENNMYLKSADFKFNIHKYGDIENNDNTADNYDFAMANMSYKNYWGNKSGLIDFECVPTDYQIEHAEDFYLYFQFNLIQRFDALSPSFHLEPNPILSPFKAHSINTTTTTSFYNKIYFDDLIDNSNRVTWRIDNLFNDLKITACNVPYLTGVSNNDSFAKAVSQERELSGVVWKNDNNLGYVIQCYAFLGCDTDTLTDAGSYSETYGFCSQVSKNTDDSITTNPNPYVPSDDTNSDGNPDSSQTVVNDGNVSLINNNYDNDNNNQTVNISSDDAELVDTLTDKFIPSNMDNTGGLTTQFTELANTNGYITFFKNTFSFVPVAVWNTLLVLLGTTCSIIAVAFVIKVLRGM